MLMDTEMMNMDDIDFWEFIDKNNSQYEISNDNGVTLRMSPHLDPDPEVEQPPSNFSILPSEDEMDVDYHINEYIKIEPVQQEMEATRIGPLQNIDATQFFGYERRAPFEVVAMSETAAVDIRETSSPEQLQKQIKKEKNRQSAKRSREKKKVEKDELLKKFTALQEKKKVLVNEVGELRLKKNIYKLVAKKLSSGVQETGDDPYEETGNASKVSWTKEDVEFVEEFLDQFPGLTVKTPMLQKEVKESPPTGFQEETRYTYKLEGYVPNLYDDMELECRRGDYTVKASSVNDGQESDGQLSSSEFFQWSCSLND